ncbi:MAG: hypothetical protein ACRDOA_19430, partial [Streptosporangiaceae bacterium]
KAWQAAIQQSGRPMVLNITQGSYTIKLAPVLKKYANQWEFAPDIEINGPDEGSANSCNAPPYTGCLSVFPLTSYAHWSDRFGDVAQWQPYGGPGGFNDYDSIEVSDGRPKAWPSIRSLRSPDHQSGRPTRTTVRSAKKFNDPERTVVLRSRPNSTARTADIRGTETWR